MKRLLPVLMLTLLVAGLGFAASSVVVKSPANPQTSLSSGQVTGTLSAGNGGTGVANNAAATLTRSGNHALTLTTTGTTALTLPTAGTLVASPATPCSWTPVDGSGAALTFTGVSSYCVRFGEVVLAWARLVYPSTVSSADSQINGFPYTSLNNAAVTASCHTDTTAANASMAMMVANTSTAKLYRAKFAAASSNADLTLATVNLLCVYPAT